MVVTRPSHHHFPSTRMPLSQIKARDFIRDFVRVRGLHKKHAHKAPEKKQQQESGLIGLLLLFFGRCAWDFIETPSGLDISKHALHKKEFVINKHAHKAPEKKQQQESGLIGLLLLFFGR